MYNKCIAERMHVSFAATDTRFGYYTSSGKMYAFDDEDEPNSVGDGTIAQLLAKIRRSLGTKDNPIFDFPSQAQAKMDETLGFARWKNPHFKKTDYALLQASVGDVVQYYCFRCGAPTWHEPMDAQSNKPEFRCLSCQQESVRNP